MGFLDFLSWGVKSAFSRDGGKSVTRIFLHHFGWEKKPPSTKTWAKNGKAPSSQWSLVLKRAQAKHLKLLGRRRLSTLLECKSLFYFIFRNFFFYSNIIRFLTVKVSAFPHTWKADYSFSCSSYLLFIPFWYYPRGAEGISQPALEPCGTPVVSPNSWDGSRQLIMILNYIYSNLDSFFFSVLVCSRIRDGDKESCFKKL